MAHYVWLGLQATAGVQEKEADAKAAKADYDAKVDPCSFTTLACSLVLPVEVQHMRSIPSCQITIFSKLQQHTAMPGRVSYFLLQQRPHHLRIRN